MSSSSYFFYHFPFSAYLNLPRRLYITLGLSRTLPVEDLAQDSLLTLVRAEYGHPKASPDINIREEIIRYSSENSASFSARPNDLIRVVELMELPDNRRLRRQLPNNLPARFLE
jgi:hypothetical protein